MHGACIECPNCGRNTAEVIIGSFVQCRECNYNVEKQPDKSKYVPRVAGGRTSFYISSLGKDELLYPTFYTFCGAVDALAAAENDGYLWTLCYMAPDFRSLKIAQRNFRHGKFEVELIDKELTDRLGLPVEYLLQKITPASAFLYKNT